MDLNLFKNKVNMQNILTVDTYTFNDSNIIGGINYNQTVNSGVDIVLGSCTVSTIEFQLNNLNNLINNLAGKEITWKKRAETSPGVFEDIQMGIFIAEKPVKVNDTRIKVKAYDRMKKFDKIIDGWLATVSYPITLKNLLTGLCTYIGVSLVTTTFLNDTYVVQKSFAGINVTGRQYLKWICEVAAKYAVINELGQLKLGWYNSIVYSVNNSNYYSVKVEDYQVKKIDKLQVRVEENDIGIIVGTGNNAYVIQNNPLLYAATDAEIRPYIELIYNAIKDFTYIPYEIKLNANPLIKAGNMFTITTRKGQVFTGIIMSRKMTNGNDVYSSTGNIDRSVNKSLNQFLIQLRGKTNVLERTIEATVSKLYDADTGDLTVLTQTVNSFNTRIQSIEANMSFTHKGDTAPLNPEIGDTWFSTSNNVFIVDNLLMTVDEMTQQVDYYSNSLNRTYRWNGSVWEHVEDGAITELRQNVSEFRQTVESIELTVEAYDGRIGTLELTANSLTSRISTAEGDISEIEQTASTISSRLLTAEGDISAIEQSVSSITSRISTAEGNISTITQNVNSITSRVSTAEGNISTLTQTATSLTTRITSAEGDISTIQQTASGITAAVNAAKLVFDSTGLTVKNGGFKILNGSDQVFYINSSGKLLMTAEFANVTGSNGVKIYNGRIEVSDGNSYWENWGSVCGSIYGEFSGDNLSGTVRQLKLEGISGASISTSGGTASVGVSGSTIYLKGTLNINGNNYEINRMDQADGDDYIIFFRRLE